MVRPSSCLLACCLLASLLLMQPASAYPSQSNYYRDEPSYDPEEIIELLNRIGNIIQMERKMEIIKDAAPSDKRSLGLDFGVGRGHTGSLQAHYLMGVAAANGADGPGRKRRNA